MKTKGNIYYLVTWIISAYLTFLCLVSVINYGTGYDLKIAIFTVFIFLFWTLLFVFNFKNVTVSKGAFLIILVLTLIIASFSASAVWRETRGLSLNPVALLLQGRLHGDNLYHSSVAASWGWYNTTSFLNNGIDKFQYHAFSHVLIGKLSRFLSMPTYFVYNYFYPVFFIPLYIFLILRTVSVLKKHFLQDNTKNVTISDLFVVSVFITGFLDTSVLDKCGIWLSSEFTSESYLVAKILVLLYVNLLFYFIKRQSKVNTVLICFILNPLFICLCSFSKISVGVLLCAGILWFFFRKHTASVKYWLLNFFCIAIFLLYYFLFAKNLNGFAIGKNAKIYFLHFVRNYTWDGYRLLHYVILLFFSSLFLYLRFYDKKITIKELVFSKDNIVEEILFIVCFVGVLPGLCLAIYGGSAGYFSYPQMLMGTILLCAFDYPSIIISNVKQNRSCVSFVFVIFMVLAVPSMFYNSHFISYTSHAVKNRVSHSCKKPDKLKLELKTHIKNYGIVDSFTYLWDIGWANNKYVNTSFYQNILEINELTKRNKRDYCVFIDEDAEINDIEFEWREQVYPSFLNMICYSGVYENAVQSAKKYDCKYLIRMFKNKYEVIKL